MALTGLWLTFDGPNRILAIVLWLSVRVSWYAKEVAHSHMELRQRLIKEAFLAHYRDSIPGGPDADPWHDDHDDTNGGTLS